MSLPTTAVGHGISSSHQPRRYEEPYRLYNLDVFEYELDSPATLYGQIPLLLGHGFDKQGNGITAGVFWFNPSETFVDISDGITLSGVCLFVSMMKHE